MRRSIRSGEAAGECALWKSIKHTLSYYHFPAPALELTTALHLFLV